MSPNATVWKRDARLWNPSGRLPRMRRKRFILQGEKRDRSYSSESCAFSSLLLDVEDDRCTSDVLRLFEEDGECFIRRDVMEREE